MVAYYENIREPQDNIIILQKMLDYIEWYVKFVGINMFVKK